MALRYAKDMPEARSKLLAYLESSAVADWQLAAATTDILVPPDVSPAPSATLPARLAAWTTNVIAAADLWWVHDDMVELVVAAAETLPVFRCHPDMLPSPTGLLAWAHPVHVRASPFTAVWAARGFAWRADEDGVWLIGYDDTPDFHGQHTGVPLTARLGWLSESTSLYIPWRDEVTFTMTPAPGEHERHNMAWVRCAVATWLLIGQTIATTASDVRLAPTVSRKLARRGHPTGVANIVSVTGGGPVTASSGDRQYRNRWLVSGHWRQQPWGPGLVLRRPVWINPYVKGPDGAPLLHAERVHTARVR